jgi:precorrin-6A/cobalt-precorrin-6A reductase
VLLTVGRKELSVFAAHPEHFYVIRTIDAPLRNALPPHTEIITARGPFTETEERDILLTHRIEVLVTKNSGGNATEAKLAAARACGVPVVMVNRPPMPSLENVEVHIVNTIPDAVQILADHP